MRKFTIQLTKAEMRIINDTLMALLEGSDINPDTEKIVRRILFVLKEKEL